MAERDAKQYLVAQENDAECSALQQKITDVAAFNENIVVEFFKSVGVRLLTQDDTTALQTAESGRALLTPDILFQEEVTVNAKRVYWLDYKDYVGSDISFLYKSNAAQADKYKVKWGDGVLCYGKGFVEGLAIPGAVLMDAREITPRLDLVACI